MWLLCPAFDAGFKRLDLGVSIDELTRFPLRAQALLWIILNSINSNNLDKISIVT